MKAKKIRVAIIGQGRSGFDIHADYLRTDSRFEIKAVADTIAERRSFAVENLGCEAVSDYRELLKRDDLDLVINASFSDQHTPTTLEALQAGHNVLCEKPLARSVRDADAMISAANDAGKLLAVYQQARFAPYFENVRRVIDSGVLGEIVQITIHFNNHSRRWDWQTLQEHHGGNLLNTGPHPLDQAIVLFGDEDPGVTCIMESTADGTFGNAENHVKLLLSGRGHPTIDLEISSCCAYPLFTYHVYGSRGGLKSSTTEAEWRYFRPAEAPEQQLQRNPLSSPEGRPIYPREELTWHTDKWSAADDSKPATTYSASAAPKQGGMTEKFYDSLYATLTEGKPFEITLEQIRRQVAVIEKAHRQNPHIYSS